MEENKKIHVLAAMDVYLPHVDGVVNCMHNLLLNYPDDVDAVAVGPAVKNFKDDFPYQVIRYKSHRVPFLKVNFGFPSHDKEFVKKLMDMDIDIIHVHCPFGVCKLLTKVARKKNIPIVATFHTNYRMVFKRILLLKCFYEPYVRKLGKRYGQMDEMFAGTKATENQLRSFGYNGTCSIAPFGTSLQEPENLEELKEQANAKFNLDKDEIVFCFVGRVVDSKRIGFSVKALHKLKQKGYKFKFIVAGKGKYEKRLHLLVKKLGMENEVILTGFVSDEDLRLVYSRADLLLFPSLLDNFALVKVEAATFNTPGLYIRNSNTAFGTTDGRNALLSDDNLKAFADKIEWALTHREELAEIGKNANTDLYFTWKDSANVMAGEYKRVIKEYKEKHTN